MKTMKKISVCIIIAALVVTGKANAQHVNLGVKAGLNVYTIHNDDGSSSSYDSRTGFHGGFLGHIHLSKHIALQPEVMYSAEGTKYNAGNSTLKLGYINVPFIFQYMFENGFRIQAGPQVGFLVNAESETNGVSVDRNDIKTVDFGLGAGLSYLHTTSGLGVDARYNFGLSNVAETGSVKSTNNGFQLGVFYMFPHKK
jgi:hypothetical protein